MEWYGNQMYIEKHAAFVYHQQRFGDLKTVGYKDVIPKFTASKFNADEWAELFARAGAKFAGPVAVHHDNFAMWDSQVTRWNSVAMGPRRDITGELEKAVRKRGMKFITTFHHGFAWQYYEPAYAFDAGDGRNADLLIRSVAGNVSRVSLLGNPGVLKMSRSAEGLTVELPARKPCDHAFVFKIAGKGLTAKPQVQE